MSRSVLTALETEWRRLARGSRARRAVARWTEQHPVFTGLRDLADVLERRRDNRAAPAILSALAEMAATDDLAARTLLHALVPGLVRLAKVVGRSEPGAIDEMVTLAWERIRTYPVCRPGSVAANVLMDVRQRYVDDRIAERPQLIPQEDVVDPSRSVEDDVLDRLAFRDLIAARRRLAEEGRGVVDDRLWRVIVLTRYAGVPLEEIARREQVDTIALKNRRWRAERRLLDNLPEADSHG